MEQEIGKNDNARNTMRLMGRGIDNLKPTRTNRINELEKVIEELKQKQKKTPNLLRRDPNSLGVPRRKGIQRSSWRGVLNCLYGGRYSIKKHLILATHDHKHQSLPRTLQK
jgi:hypothetical protein